MGALNGPLKPKRSTISGEVPSPGDLQSGELAANTADGKLFVKHTDGTIKTIAGDLDNFATVATTGDYADLINAPVPVTASHGALLQYRTGEGYAEKTIGQILNGSTEAAVVGANLNDLSNVGTTAPTDGQALVWDNANSEWKPGTISGGGGGASAIDDLSDVDTSTTPPINGQALIWDNAASEWKPGSVAAGDLSTASVGEFSDVDLSAQPVRKLIDFETENYSLKDPLGTVSTPGFRQTATSFAGSYAYQVNTVAYGDGSKIENGLEKLANQYDIVSLHIRSSAALDTNNRLSLGGNKSNISSGGGWTMYTRDTGFGFYADSAFEEIGTRPTLAADTWYHVIYVLNWENSRYNLPAISMWIDGSQVINNVTPNVAYIYSDSSDFNIATSSAGTGQQKYWDNIRILQYDSIDWAMTDASLNMSDAITWIDAQTQPTGFNHVLRWNGSKFVPTGADTGVPLTFKGLSDLATRERTNGDYGATIQGIDEFSFESQDYVSGRTSSDDVWSFYTNATYGMAFGEYTPGINGTRLYCAPDHGILLNAGRTGVTYLCRHITPAVNGSQQPELRWHTGGPVNDSGNYVGIKVSNTISSNYTYTLPVADGTSGQVLSTDGSGVTSWVDAAPDTAITWQLTANGSTDYIFTGPGLDGVNDPTIYLTRGQTYKFVNEMGAHPFKIQQVGGTAYSSGITNNEVSNGTLTFEVPMDAPSTLEYVCTSHPAMTGTIYVLAEDSISLATLKTEVAAATDFADFQSRIAAL